MNRFTEASTSGSAGCALQMHTPDTSVNKSINNDTAVYPEARASV